MKKNKILIFIISLLLLPLISFSAISGALSPNMVINDSTIGAIPWDSNLDYVKISDGNYTTNTEYLSSGTILENSIKIVKGGIISGNEKSVGAAISDNLLYMPYGSISDLWGLSWTSADINNSDFGVVISYMGDLETSYYLKATNFGFTIPENATINGIKTEIQTIRLTYVGGYYMGIDHIRITIYYTEEEALPAKILTMGSSTDMLAYIGSLFTDLWVLIALAVGIPLSFYIIRKVISVIKK
jgi:hypothetical protein